MPRIDETDTVILDAGYNPLAGRSEAEALEWHLFATFLSFDAEAGRGSGEPERVLDHIEWVLQRPFQNVAEWLGPEGDEFRRTCCMAAVSEQFKTDWAAFLHEHRGQTLEQVVKGLELLQQRFEQTEEEGRIWPASDC